MSDQSTLTASPGVGVSASPGAASKRLISVDVMRGFTIISMVFVNDMADLIPVKPIQPPQWMRHMGNVNGFTYVDLIIPIFMFLLGMSIPLALGKRLAQGRSMIGTIGHVIVRAAALIVMGLFDVNRGGQGMSPGYVQMLDWPLGLWKFLAWTFIFIIWLDFPIQTSGERWAKRICSVVSIGGLIWLAVVFRSSAGNPPRLGYFTTSWWGTLGQLGWAYMVTSFAWLALNKLQSGTLVRIGILALFVAMHAAFIAMSSKWWPSDKTLFINEAINFLKKSTLTTYAANTMAGLCIGTLLGKAVKDHVRIGWALGLAAATGTAAFVLSRNVEQSMYWHMPATGWSLAATTIALLAWTALYWLTDIKGLFTKLLDPLRVVGQNSLLIYQLSRYGMFIIYLSGLTFYAAVAQPPIVGIFRSLGYAIVLAAITYYATKKKIFLKV